MTRTVEYKCPSCETGTIRPHKEAGRIWNRPEGPWEIPAHVAIPTCAQCKAEWIDAKTALALDEAYTLKDA